MELNTNKKTNYRWIVCGFLWVAVAVNYVDRTALSAATPIIMKEFNIDGTEMGIIMAAFFWAYALLQVPMGLLVLFLNGFQNMSVLGLLPFLIVLLNLVMLLQCR